MCMCGMSNAAGEFYFKIGAPAKSGRSGCIMVIIPNVGGFATFSPRVDKDSNSVRGLAFSLAMVSRFAFHGNLAAYC